MPLVKNVLIIGGGLGIGYLIYPYFGVIGLVVLGLVVFLALTARG